MFQDSVTTSDEEYKDILRHSCEMVCYNGVITETHFRFLSQLYYSSLRASSPFGGYREKYTRERRRDCGGRGRERESLQPSLIKFHSHPGNPGTL